MAVPRRATICKSDYKALSKRLQGIFERVRNGAVPIIGCSQFLICLSFSFPSFYAKFLRFQNPPPVGGYPFLFYTITHPTKTCDATLRFSLPLLQCILQELMMIVWYTFIHYNAWDEKKITSMYILHLLFCRGKTLKEQKMQQQQRKGVMIGYCHFPRFIYRTK